MVHSLSIQTSDSHPGGLQTLTIDITASPMVKSPSLLILHSTWRSTGKHVACICQHSIHYIWPSTSPYCNNTISKPYIFYRIIHQSHNDEITGSDSLNTLWCHLNRISCVNHVWLCLWNITASNCVNKWHPLNSNALANITRRLIGSTGICDSNIPPLYFV